MNDELKQREFTRSDVRVSVEVSIPNGTVMEGQADNVSMNGLRLQCATPLPLDTECDIVLVLDGGHEQIRVHTHGKVTRLDPDGMAVQFSRIDAAGFDHLRRLVLFNSPDADKTEAEFEEHVGLRRVDVEQRPER